MKFNPTFGDTMNPWYSDFGGVPTCQSKIRLYLKYFSMISIQS